LFGLRVWPAVLLGAFLVNVTTIGSVPASLGIAVGNTLETVGGVWLINRFAGGTAAFARPQGVLQFGYLAILAATIGATIGNLSLWVGGHAETASLPGIWLTWWLGDAVSAVLFAPFVILWTRPWRAPRVPGSRLEGVLLSIALALTVWTVFTGIEPASFAALPLLVWAALRFGRRGTITAAMATSAIALWATLEGLGPFGVGSTHHPLLFLEAYIGVFTLTSLVLAAATMERQSVENELRRSRDELEERVRQRTASLATAVRDLHRSRAVLNEAQRVAHIGSWEWDVLGNEVVWSDELYRIYGLEPGSVRITYQTYMDRVHPDDRESTAAFIQAALESEDAFEYEERVVRPQGEVRVLQSKGYVVRDESGLPRRMIGTCHDITERKEAELELERRMEALDRSNRELSVLSYAASHDLKEPLRTVASNVQLIERQLREVNGAPEIQRSARYVVDGVRRMDELITDLLEYSTADRRIDGEVESGQALAEALERLRVSIEETGARIEIGPMPRVAASHARLVALFQNLVSNAIKYRDGGAGPEIRISAEREGEMWRFAVADNGCGFDPADAETIFVVFQRLGGDHGVPGTGLGLAICRRIVEAQGGRIWAESEPGRGSIFRFTLPRAGA
jgi:PAS domain S-box-containing protein